jgi:hypothetical protein
MDYNARQNKRLTGVTPHSVYLDGKFRSSRRFDPADTIITTLTGVRDLREAGRHSEADELATAILASFLNLAQDKTFMQGVTTFVEAMNSPEDSLQAYGEGLARSLTPQMITMFNNDPYYRDAQGLYENFISKIPSLSETLPPKRDILGKPILRPEDGVAPSSLVSNQVVRLEFADIQSSIAQIPEREDNGMLNWKDERYVMGGVSAYDRYSELVGTVRNSDGLNLEQVLENVILSDGYKNSLTTSLKTPDANYRGSKEGLILEAITAFRKIAKNKVLQEYKETGILAVFNQHKINKQAALTKATSNLINTDVDSIIKEYKSNN